MIYILSMDVEDQYYASTCNTLQNYNYLGSKCNCGQDTNLIDNFVFNESQSAIASSGPTNESIDGSSNEPIFASSSQPTYLTSEWIIILPSFSHAIDKRDFSTIFVSNSIAQYAEDVRSIILQTNFKGFQQPDGFVFSVILSIGSSN